MTEQVLSELSALNGRRFVLTIGNFDGVHRGHQYLLERLVIAAREAQAASVALTFDPLPGEVLRPEAAPPRLCTTEQRVNVILSCGVDLVVVEPFTREFAQQEPEAFVDHLCALGLAGFVVGDDFHFGHNRRGTPALLQQLSERYGFRLTVVSRIAADHTPLSSTAIRQAIAAGDVATAATLLGRPYVLSGTVVEGRRRGRLLGFPTANLALPARLAVPADGIYAARVAIDTDPTLLDALVYIGVRPTFHEEMRTIEVYLLDRDIVLYGKTVHVLFVERLRGDQAFESVDALIEQMQRDEQAGRAALAALPADWPPPLTWTLLNQPKGVKHRP
ncbi:MAG: bifunctional riboflavin kinase/FAD synthetase [Thermorudis peleae]|nr:bifunctional riboflavin kinase/FAD synthetase [Thermorudis peleae]